MTVIFRPLEGLNGGLGAKDSMTPTNKIAINTAVTYFRSVIAIVLTLFSSRWVLQALGATDFGLFNIVGSLIILATFLNAVVAGASMRFFAFEIGRGNTEEVNRWFNTALILHAVLPVTLIALFWPIGEYAIEHWLTVPRDRVSDCIFVFRVSIAGACVSMFSVPFVAMFNARQRIFEVALWDSLQVVMVFVLAYFILQLETQQLVTYAAAVVGINILIDTIKIARAIRIFQECEVRLHWRGHSSRFRALLHFSIWTAFGGLAQALSKHGAAVLLNMYSGPVVNAAFGLAHQVANQANQFSLAIQSAFAPEIISSEGRGQRGRVMAMAHFSSKFSCIAVLLFAIPLLVEMDFILELWLIHPPSYTAEFCRWLLSAFLVERLTIGYVMAINASGKVAAYQATVGGTLLLVVPVAWLLFSLNCPPTSLGVVILAVAIAAAIVRLLWLRRLFDEQIRRWARFVLFPCMIVAGTALTACWLPRDFMDASAARLGSVALAGPLFTGVAAWLFAFDDREKGLFREVVGKLTAAFRSPRPF